MPIRMVVVILMPGGVVTLRNCLIVPAIMVVYGYFPVSNEEKMIHQSIVSALDVAIYGIDYLLT